jgi:hypothetical protein
MAKASAPLDSFRSKPFVALPSLRRRISWLSFVGIFRG